MVLKPSPFIRPIHPKTEIRPDPAAIRRVLDVGWCGQLKIHGHRAQIHIPADLDQDILIYNRQGQLHKRAVPPAAAVELRRIFGPQRGWTVIDAEWLKESDHFFVFDILKREGQSLVGMSFAERWELLPRVYASDSVETLPIYKTLERCMEALARPEPYIEGLVFRALATPGFSDTSIVRCRRAMP